MVNIIHNTLAALKADEILGGGGNVTGLENALLEVNLETKLLVDLITADAA